MTSIDVRFPTQASKFPQRIGVILILGVVLSLTGLALAVWTIRNNTNEQAAADSVRLVSSSLRDLQSALSNVNNDYSRWDEAFDALLAGDLQWIYDNYAVTATNSVLFDGLIFFGGPLAEPLAWSASKPQVEPLPPFLSPDLLELVAQEVARLPLGQAQSFDMMTVLDGQLALLSATHLQPYMPARLEGLDPAMVPISVLTQRLDEAALADMAGSLFLPELTFARQPVAGLLVLPVVGPEGEQLGFLSWAPHQPGSEIVETMAPVLGATAFVFALLGGVAAWLARAHARHLVWEEAEARQIARIDSLTGLPNRLSFSGYLKRLERESIPQLGILFLDLNGFKKVNDTIGHAGGDALLADVAWRLARLAGEGTFLARLGGDEFVFVLSGVEGVAPRAGTLTLEVATALEQPFDILSRQVQISASQGLALCNGPDVSTDELVRRADLAMYRAKRDHSIEAQTYSAELDGHLHPDSTMEEALRSALIRPEEFTVLYQPIVDSSSGALVKAEALARWTSPALGPVPPSLFIPVAERAGLMNDLGRLIRDRICIDLARCPDLRVSMNISPVELRNPNLPSDLSRALALHGIAVDRIELEVPEDVLVEQGERTTRQIGILREMGFTIALGDFGTRYSSVGYLRQLRFDTLKIDESVLSSGSLKIGPGFLAGDPEGHQSAALIRGIAQLGASLGMTVICEGVETEAQALALRESGCALLQGFYFGRPMALDMLLADHPAALGRAA